jgi:hypothetical protein
MYRPGRVDYEYTSTPWLAASYGVHISKLMAHKDLSSLCLGNDRLVLSVVDFCTK